MVSTIEGQGIKALDIYFLSIVVGVPKKSRRPWLKFTVFKKNLPLLAKSTTVLLAVLKTILVVGTPVP